MLVGSEIPESDLYKLSIRSPFERGVLQHFHTQEHVLDYIFWVLGIKDESVKHPLLITETACSPNYSRDLLLELAFEAYAAPSVNFGVDAVFALRKNCGPKSTAMVVSYGHQATHIIPCINGEFLPQYMKRINIGGDAVHTGTAEIPANQTLLCEKHDIMATCAGNHLLALLYCSGLLSRS